MNKYSLVATREDGEKRVILIKEKDKNTGNVISKDKTSLSFIDNLTMKYEDEDELLEVLKDNGILKDKKYTLAIQYVYNKEIKSLPLAYKEHNDLQPFNLNCVKNKDYEIDIVETAYEYQKFLEKFIKHAKDDGEYIRFLVSNGFMSEYLANIIRDYVSNLALEDNKDIKIKNRGNLLDISKYLKRYKELRDLIIGHYKYYEYLLDQNNKHDDLVSDVQRLYDSDGLDGVYATYDLDDLLDLTPEERKKLSLPH